MKEDNQVVYIFGAGASCEMGVPISKGFFSTTYQLAEEHKIQKYRNDELGYYYQRVAQYFERYKNISLYSCYSNFSPTITDKNLKALESFYPEEILEEIDKKIDGFKNQNSFTEKDVFQEGILHFQDYRDAFGYIIFLTISKTMNFQQNYYDCMVNSLLWEYNTCLISLNYDTLLDEAIRSKYNRRWSYGISFSDIDDIPINVDLQPDRFDLILLKPHGSLNWLICPECGYLSLHWEIEYIERRYIKRGDTTLPGLILASRNKPCPKCNKKQGHFLIPPKPKKELEQVSQTIMKLAKKYLSNANKIIIIGYSFPDQDEHVRDLLSNSIKTNENHIEIEIVDINETKAQESVTKLKKFLNGNINIYPSKTKGFTDYVKQITSSSQDPTNTKSRGDNDTR